VLSSKVKTQHKNISNA